MKKLIVLLTVFLLVFSFSVSAGAEEYMEGSWAVSKTEDPLTDEIKLILLTNANRSNAIGLRYQNGTLEIMMMTEYLGTDSDEYFKEVAYRFDKNDVINTIWGTATGDRGLFYKEDEDTQAEFIEKMMTYEQLAVGYYPYEENRKTVVFDLTGFTAAITPYLDTMGLEELK